MSKKFKLMCLKEKTKCLEIFLLPKHEEGCFLVLPEVVNQVHNVTSFSLLDGTLVMSPLFLLAQNPIYDPTRFADTVGKMNQVPVVLTFLLLHTMKKEYNRKAAFLDVSA